MKESVYRAILDYITRYGYPPTTGEICAMVGLKSKATAKKYLDELDLEGKIEVKKDSPRAIRLCEYDIELRPRVTMREEEV